MYKQKYHKYKKKYLKLKGGYFNTVEFIKTNTTENIKKKLLNILKNDTEYCDIILGKGMMGEVYVSSVGKFMDINVENEIINIYVAIKKANAIGTFDMKTIDNILYIYSYKDLTCEAIILEYMSEIWRKGLTPHLPLMVGYGTCDNDKSIINKLIIEKHGLEKNIKVDINGVHISPIFHPDSEYNSKNPEYQTQMTTLADIFRYILMCEKNGKMILPNGQKCNVSKLCDYLAISYLHTYHLLAENKILLHDMHPRNVFLHWLNNKSYMGNKNISNIKYIQYEIGKGKYLKMKTYGIILKIGDVGGCIVQPKKDIYILGQAVDLDKTYVLIKDLMDPRLGIGFFYYFKNNLPHNIYQQTIINKIISTYPYSELALGKVPYELLDKMESPLDILNKFISYITSGIKELDDIIVPIKIQ